MPQMSPLMWSLLFISFSILLALAMIKTFFIHKKSVNQIPQLTTMVPQKSSPHWMW